MTNHALGLSLVLAAVAVESCAQLFMKVAALRAFARGWIAAAVVAMLGEVALYTAALRFLDVSVAFPIGSLCFVGVALLSRVFLSETVGGGRWLGIVCIVAGAVCVAL